MVNMEKDWEDVDEEVFQLIRDKIGEYEERIINRKRIIFHGKSLKLFGKYLLWLLLTIITFGIYGLWVPLKFYDFEVSNTNLKLKNEYY